MARSAPRGKTSAVHDFESFVFARWVGLNRFAYAVTGDAQDAADALQDALAAVFPKWAQIADGHPDAYLRRAIVNAHLNNHRRAGRAHPADYLDDWAGPGPDAAERLADADLAGRLLDGLPRQQRAAVVMRYLDDAGYPDIAAACGVTEATARSLVRHALASLRAAISPDGQAAQNPSQSDPAGPSDLPERN